jgi:hypothetical protein
MTTAEAMRAIEGERFAALTNLASNLKTFLRIAADQPEVEALTLALANDPALGSEVFHRALGLLATPADGDHEHGGDAALATYLWLLLSNHPQEFAQLGAGIARGQGHFFWARKIAHDPPPVKGIANANGKVAEGKSAVETTEDTPSS